MVVPVIRISQPKCNEFIIKDITAPWSAQNLGGYGVYNVDADQIVLSKVTLDFGKRGAYTLEKYYNQTQPDWVIKASEIPYSNPVITPGCTDCAPPCGPCDTCNDSEALSKDCNGYLSSFPSGCIGIKYEVFGLNMNEQDIQTGEDLEALVMESKGLTLFNFRSVCKEDEKFFKVADTLTNEESECYNFYEKKQTRLDAMRGVTLSWAKLGIIQNDKEADCDCMASSLKQINNYLDEILNP